MIYDDLSIGPIGKADRDLLVAVANYYNQPSVLEYGSGDGHSAQAWLDGGAGVVHCVDMQYTQGLRSVVDANSGRIEYFNADQVKFIPPRQYDIIFIDASHDFKANLITLEIAQKALLPYGCVVVHDTAKWAAVAMTDAHKAFHGEVDQDGGKWHQKGEAEFVQWMSHNGWQCVNFSSRTAMRHGLSVCQPTK